MTNTSSDDSEGSKLLLTVAEAAHLMGVGDKHLRTLIAHRPDFPVVQVSPHRVLIPRGRLYQWLGYRPTVDASGPSVSKTPMSGGVTA